MGFRTRNIFLASIAAVLVSFCLAGGAGKAHAGIIPYSVIAPHEYQLPVGDAIPRTASIFCSPTTPS
jgi:hypothetical protein